MSLNDELDLIDLTIKKFTQPSLELNVEILKERAVEIVADKQAAMGAVGVGARGELLSNNNFIAMLGDAGVEHDDLPRKISPTTGNVTWALSKNDSALKEVVKKYPGVKPLVDARIAVKSTQEETRIQRFIDVAENTEATFGRPLLPVPIAYYGAHTGRFSGLDRLNLQNLGRGSVLRSAIQAPPGHKIVAADFAQIEARINATLACQDDLVEDFAKGRDVYALFASDVYGFKVNKTDHPQERFIGKTGILSLGYQAGYAKFHDTMNNVFNTPMSEADAIRIVGIYRRKYSQIVSQWHELQELIPTMLTTSGREYGPVTFKHKKVILPNGMPIMYHKLEKTGREWQYSNGRGMVKLYGGKLVENIVQALARIVMTTAELRLARHGLSAALSVHDELVFVVPERKVAEVMMIIKAVMEQPVKWLPNLPVLSEIDAGDNYGEVK